MSNRTTRRIAGAATGAAWSAIIAATVIQPHIQIYMTVWLITLVTTLTTVAMWMARPDHGLLGHVRLKIAALRMEEAIKEELNSRRHEREPGRLTVV
ncbi:hypothetical protein ACIBG7_18825 [Nonomuraea sp. NPDC050328]|uniref:hypothetical protein n=1 Tax=Nonomuraea sp. NPDC050328 TaxID=3364361 RepID=UPI0037B8A60B